MTLNQSSFTNVLDSFEHGLAFIDDNDRIVFCNSTYKTLHPLTEEEDTPDRILDYFPLSERTKVQELLKTLREEQGPGQAEHGYVTLRGDVFRELFETVFDNMGNRQGIMLKSIASPSETTSQELSEADESKQDRLEETVRKQEHMIKSLESLSKICEMSLPLDILLEEFLYSLIEMFSVDCGLIKMVDPQLTFFYQPKVFHGLSDGFLKKIANGLIGECICAKAAAQQSIFYTHDAGRDRENRCSTCKEEGLKLVIAMPITSKGQVKGVIQLASKKVRHLKDDEKKMLDIANKIINSAFEATESSAELERTGLYFNKILSAGRDAVLAINPDGIIETCSEAFSKMVDMPVSDLKNKNISGLLDSDLRGEIQKMLTEDSLSDSPVSLETVVSGNIEKIEATATVWPVRNKVGQIKMIIAQLRNADEDRAFRLEIEKRDREAAAISNVISFLGTQDNIQSYCKKALEELSKLFSVSDKQFLVYYHDEPAQQLRLVAHEGCEPERIEEIHTISSESYEYKNALNNGAISSSVFPTTGLWETVIPLDYKGKVRGIMIVYGKKEMPSGLAEAQQLKMLGHIVGSVMEKQALYDALEVNNDTIGNYKEKVEIISEGLKNLDPTDTTQKKLERICRILLETSKAEKLTYTLFIDDDTWRYTLSRKGDFKKEQGGTINPSSREEWVLNHGVMLYSENIKSDKEKFMDDAKAIEKGIASVTVLPVLEGGSLSGTLKLENKTGASRDEILYRLISVLDHMVIGLIRQDTQIEERRQESSKLAAQPSQASLNQLKTRMDEQLNDIKTKTHRLSGIAEEIMKQTSVHKILLIADREASLLLSSYSSQGGRNYRHYLDNIKSQIDPDSLDGMIVANVCTMAYIRCGELTILNSLLRAV